HARRHPARDPRFQPGRADLAAGRHGNPLDPRHRAGEHAALVHDDDHALQGRAAGDRLPVDGEWPVLRRHRRRLRHADGGRARRGARRAGGGADPRRFHFRDSRALRHARHAAPREAQGALMPIELLALLLSTNNLGVMWVAMEAATLTTVLLVALYRTHASLEAAWKYFILCGVGIAQALFGTILVYFAAEKVLGPGTGSLLWTHLDAVKTDLQPPVI